MRKEKIQVGPLFLTVFLDMLGIGIMVPVLPALFSNTESNILPVGTSQQQSALYYAMLSAIYPFMQFFGAPILGALSDKYGRKPLLQISLLGAAIGYLMLALAIKWNSLPMLFLARAIPGFMAGNISIIFSVISDITAHAPDHRPRYFGLVGAAFGLGFILGPALGGILADDAFVSWFSYSTPFYFTTALTLSNIILIQFNLPETLVQRKEAELSFMTGMRNVQKAFSYPNLRGLFTVSLFYSLGFSFFTTFFAFYMMRKFSMNESQTGLIFAWVGLWLVITQLVIVRRLSGRVIPQNIIKYTMLAVGFAIPFLLIPQNNPWWVLTINPFIAMLHGMTSPNLTTLVSGNALPDQQGEILGINQSMVSLGQFVPAILGGILTSFWLPGPLLAAGVFIVIAWVVFMRLKL